MRRRCGLRQMSTRSTPIVSDEPIFKTPEKSVTPDYTKYRTSTAGGWKRAFLKFSPSTEIKVSPLKAAQTNLKSNLLKKTDRYLDIFTWVVNMSEQFYYDNTLLLLNGVKTDISQMKKRLRQNYQAVDFEFFKKLKDLILLGEGSFGSVYKATDKYTQRNYAIKFISSKSKNSAEHCSNILDYMAERNSIIRAMNSPFVMKFFYSLHMKQAGGMFLFFEFCIGDLWTLMSEITYEYLPEVSERLIKHDTSIIQDLDKDVNILDVMLLYIFEMFCGLDFLVQANIIHQDIKPENLMVSEILHVKIGDFGLIYRTRAIHRETNSWLVKHNKIDKTESSNYELSVMGTVDYEDLELRLMQLEDSQDPLFLQVIENEKLFNATNLRYDEDILVPTFLTDTWAAGIVCINLLFRGYHPFDPDMISDDVLPGIPRKSTTEFLVHVVGRKALYQKYVYKGLINSGGPRFKELMEFIASIFLPRENRSKRYRKSKEIHRYTKTLKLHYIDMVKLEKIQSFRDRNFNSKNVFTLTVPEKIRNYFKKKTEVKFATFEKLLESTAKSMKGKSLIELKPGITINYFQ